MQTMQAPGSTVWVPTPEHTTPPPAPLPRTLHAGHVRVGQEGRTLPADNAPVERVRVLPHTPRVHSGLPPREDHASNLVGSLRDTIGRRWFRAVCGIGLEMDEGAGHAMFLCSYSTCTGPRRLAQGPRSRGARSALTFCRSNDRARAARVSEAV